MDTIASQQEMAEFDLHDPRFKTDAFMVYGFKVNRRRVATRRASPRRTNTRHSLRSRRVVERGVTTGANVPMPIAAKWPVVETLSSTPMSVSSAPMPKRSTCHSIRSDAINVCRLRRVRVEIVALTRIVYLSTGCIQLGPFRQLDDGTMVACAL